MMPFQNLKDFTANEEFRRQMKLKHSPVFFYQEAEDRETCVQFRFWNDSFINSDPRYCKIEYIREPQGKHKSVHFWLQIIIYNQNRLQIYLKEEDIKFITITKKNPYQHLLVWENTLCKDNLKERSD